jgi:hypothetical protein
MLERYVDIVKQPVIFQFEPPKIHSPCPLKQLRLYQNFSFWNKRGSNIFSAFFHSPLPGWRFFGRRHHAGPRRPSAGGLLPSPFMPPVK